MPGPQHDCRFPEVSITIGKREPSEWILNRVDRAMRNAMVLDEDVFLSMHWDLGYGRLGYKRTLEMAREWITVEVK